MPVSTAFADELSSLDATGSDQAPIDIVSTPSVEPAIVEPAVVEPIAAEPSTAPVAVDSSVGEIADLPTSDQATNDWQINDSGNSAGQIASDAAADNRQDIASETPTEVDGTDQTAADGAKTLVGLALSGQTQNEEQFEPMAYTAHDASTPETDASVGSHAGDESDTVDIMMDSAASTPASRKLVKSAPSVNAMIPTPDASGTPDKKNTPAFPSSADDSNAPEPTLAQELLVAQVDGSGDINNWVDPNPASLLSASLNRHAYAIGDTLVLAYEVADADGIYGNATVWLAQGTPEDWRRGSGHGWGTNAACPDGQLTFRVTSDDTPGAYRVVGLEVRDKAGYSTTFWDEEYAAATGREGPTTLPRLEFTIEGSEDPNPASLLSASLNRHAYAIGDTLVLAYEVADADGIYGNATVWLAQGTPEDWRRGSGHGWGTNAACPDGQLTFRVTSDDTPGAYRVVGLEVRDKAGYSTTFWDEEYAAATGREGPTTLPRLEFTIVAPGQVRYYAVTQGDKTTLSANDAAGATFVFNAPAESLVAIDIDGEQIPEEAYSVASGSTIVTIHQSFLATLTPGEHTIAAIYENANRSIATFTVLNSEQQIEQSSCVADETTFATAYPHGAKLAATGGSSMHDASTTIPATGDATEAGLISTAFAGISSLLSGFMRRKREK